jgi:hypothetical protein
MRLTITYYAGKLAEKASYKWNLCTSTSDPRLVHVVGVTYHCEMGQLQEGGRGWPMPVDNPSQDYNPFPELSRALVIMTMTVTLP